VRRLSKLRPIDCRIGYSKVGLIANSPFSKSECSSFDAHDELGITASAIGKDGKQPRHADGLLILIGSPQAVPKPSIFEDSQSVRTGLAPVPVTPAEKYVSYSEAP
jgi:hypothetical protein